MTCRLLSTWRRWRRLCAGCVFCWGLVIAQGGKPRLMDKVSRQILAAVKALTSAGYHNIRADRKLSMLASPSWRARVLRDLGGIAVLERWERIMAKRRAAMDAILRGGLAYEPRTYPSEAQRLARVANLKKGQAGFISQALSTGLP